MSVVDVCAYGDDWVDIAACDFSGLTDGEEERGGDDDIWGGVLVGSAEAVGHYEAAKSFK